jgi:hypothetical protein
MLCLPDIAQEVAVAVVALSLRKHAVLGVKHCSRHGQLDKKSSNPPDLVVRILRSRH